jgi:hypothetical protein
VSDGLEDLSVKERQVVLMEKDRNKVREAVLMVDGSNVV